MNNDFKLTLADTIALSVSFGLALIIRLDHFFGPFNFEPLAYTISLPIGLLFLITIFSGFGLYKTSTIELSARISIIFKAWLIWFLVGASVVYGFKLDFSRLVFFLTAFLTLFLVTLARYYLFQRRLKEKNGQSLKIIIIGHGKLAEETKSLVRSFYPQAIFPVQPTKTSSLIKELSSHPANEIFLADENLSSDEVLSLIGNTALFHHNFRVINDTFRLITGHLESVYLDEIQPLNPRKNPPIVYLLSKRVFDFIISSLGLVLTWPLWCLIALFIKLEDNGPIFIRQTRIGHKGRPFTILKFRTMKETSLLYELAPKDEADNRITRVGRFLRRLSLDELPQLWNIWKGQMSLVGPRPEMSFIVERYEPWQSIRLLAKPGLTGLWQILGRKDLPLHENLEYDFYYVCNRGLFLDISIILKTLPAVIFGKGAY